MWRLLLDVLPYDGPRRPRVIDITPKDPPVINVDTDTAQQAVDSTSIENLVDSASQNFIVGNGTSGDDMTMMFASIFVVLFALALCLYFVFKYRRMTLTAKQ